MAEGVLKVCEKRAFSPLALGKRAGVSTQVNAWFVRRAALQGVREMSARLSESIWTRPSCIVAVAIVRSARYFNHVVSIPSKMHQ